MAFWQLIEGKSAMREQDAVEDSKPRLEITSRWVRAVDLIQRLVIREKDITGERCEAILGAAGVKVSLMSANMIVSDAKRMLRHLDRSQLLVDDFERARRRVASDFVEVIPRKKRRSSR